MVFLFRMNLLSVEHFLNIFGITFSGCNSKATANPPKSDDQNGQEMLKKCSTDKRFIRKRNTTYRIHTLDE